MHAEECPCLSKEQNLQRAFCLSKFWEISLSLPEVDNKSYGDAGSGSCEMRCLFSFGQNQNLSLLKTKKYSKKCDCFWLPFNGQIKNHDLVFLFCR